MLAFLNQETTLKSWLTIESLISIKIKTNLNFNTQTFISSQD